MATARDLRKRFRFLGDHGAYHFLWAIGEQVPPYDEWAQSRGLAPTPQWRQGLTEKPKHGGNAAAKDR